MGCRWALLALVGGAFVLGGPVVAQPENPPASTPVPGKSDKPAEAPPSTGNPPERPRNPGELPIKIPSPLVLVDKDAISVGVVSARMEDEGVRSLLKTAWATIQSSGLSSTNIFSMILGFLSQTTQDNILLNLLPVQAVRVVHLDANGRESSTFMVTMQGYPGIQQSMLWPSFRTDPAGKPYTVKTTKTPSFIIRPKPGQDTNQASAVTRLDGTYYAFPDVARAERMLEGKVEPPPEIMEMLDTVDQHQDTYGVMINRRRSLESFFEWINVSDYRQVQNGVGAQKLSQALEHVESLAWTGDLVSDDQMNMQIRFRNDNNEHARALADVLNQTRHILKDVGRAGDLQMTTVDRDVLLQIQMVGYRAMLINYLRNGKS